MSGEHGAVTGTMLDPSCPGDLVRLEPDRHRSPAAAPADGRAASTAIYFLLKRGERSHWHTVDAVEIWHWHAGLYGCARYYGQQHDVFSQHSVSR